MPQHMHKNRRFPKGPVNRKTGEFIIGPYTGRINRNGGIITIRSKGEVDQYRLQQFWAGRDWRLLK